MSNQFNWCLNPLKQRNKYENQWERSEAINVSGGIFRVSVQSEFEANAHLWESLLSLVKVAN